MGLRLYIGCNVVVRLYAEFSCIGCIRLYLQPYAYIYNYIQPLRPRARVQPVPINP